MALDPKFTAKTDSNRRFIVTTTINPPTEAIRLFDLMRDWTLIVVGDHQTPSDYRLTNGVYLPPEDQRKLAPELSDLIGWNSIQRRTIGFVLALDLGAEIVATVDDDNIPYESWGRDLMVGRRIEMRAYHAPNGCFDPIGATEHRHLWHRGYPLQLLRSRDYSQSTPKPVQVDVQAGFWDGDPNVDAICRMEHGPDVRFDPTSFPFSSTSVSPFNSQNTILSRDAVSHFPMLPGIGRMDDIWAAYHLQWLGFSVAYGPATVRQNRNPHDLTQNFNDEVFGYQHTASLIAAINSGTYRTEDFWPDRAQRTHEAYLRRVGA